MQNERPEQWDEGWERENYSRAQGSPSVFNVCTPVTPATGGRRSAPAARWASGEKGALPRSQCLVCLGHWLWAHQQGTDIYFQVCCSFWSLSAFELLHPLWFPCRDWASVPVCRSDSLSGLNNPLPERMGGAGLCPGLLAASWNLRGHEAVADPEDQHCLVRLWPPQVSSSPVLPARE